MRPPTKLQVFVNFWPQKKLQPFISPCTIQIYLRQNILCSRSWKAKLKWLHFADVAEIQEAVTDELKKAQKKETYSSFSETVWRRKSLYIYYWSLIE
jgi:hypothetical protein